MQHGPWSSTANVNLYCFKSKNTVHAYADDLDTQNSCDNPQQEFQGESSRLIPILSNVSS
jgi:hypothetical protein